MEYMLQSTDFVAAIFGLIFAALAEIGKTQLIFVCNAVSLRSYYATLLLY